MKYELGLEKPDVNRARNSAATIGISYIIGGLVPLSAYFFSNYLFTDQGTSHNLHKCVNDVIYYQGYVTVFCI